MQNQMLSLWQHIKELIVIWFEKNSLDYWYCRSVQSKNEEQKEVLTYNLCQLLILYEIDAIFCVRRTKF